MTTTPPNGEAVTSSEELMSTDDEENSTENPQKELSTDVEMVVEFYDLKFAFCYELIL